ncbi:hypothetical protein FA13DRAFT_1727511 [Coprinellus micaceus]|uniref:Zinc-ribbon 15 domain-containing protein n=1 Tax=Coprinellus micaceus TaxID=71717 RepID=A0A4Y7TP13_COPMI|nr:hypothetical protein FA13DRAFT_1727511 [Coprinellus micaceus]
MDFFFCLPVLFGCKTTLKAEGDQTPRICPRCNNAAVISAKSREWFEICFVPLIPMSSKHIWTCTICQWSVQNQPGAWEPALPGHAGPPPVGYYPRSPARFPTSTLLPGPRSTPRVLRPPQGQAPPKY